MIKKQSNAMLEQKRFQGKKWYGLSLLPLHAKGIVEKLLSILNDRTIVGLILDPDYYILDVRKTYENGSERTLFWICKAEPYENLKFILTMNTIQPTSEEINMAIEFMTTLGLKINNSWYGFGNTQASFESDGNYA